MAVAAVVVAHRLARRCSQSLVGFEVAAVVDVVVAVVVVPVDIVPVVVVVVVVVVAGGGVVVVVAGFASAAGCRWADCCGRRRSRCT